MNQAKCRKSNSFITQYESTIEEINMYGVTNEIKNKTIWQKKDNTGKAMRNQTRDYQKDFMSIRILPEML